MLKKVAGTWGVSANLSIGDLEHIFIPVNVGCVHWLLLDVLPQHNKILCYDSLANQARTDAVTRPVARFMQEYSRSTSSWSYQQCAPPQQRDGVNCGVFTLMYAFFCGQGMQIPQTLCTSNMRAVRQWLCCQLVIADVLK
jgi:Ulp1 family protease